ncbi:hypothetical protein DY218_02430 [Streptomyces triticagri]|uniref:Uncharacterized protein n=1 Tax=Streptomyces triticagri TaxID=2293568 RepID=A0A372MCI2_9ACTN|nr:hypothetical protein [Streptomyces triticagri]RFU88300.1 hypothetical protein DY218_02430 [Streptomyces triticagri]
MTYTRHTALAGRSPSPQLPTTIWLPRPDDYSVAQTGQVLPEWALDKVRSQFTRGTTGEAAPLVRLEVTEATAGPDARIRCTTTTAPDAISEQHGNYATVLLAELHPNVLPAAALRISHDLEERGTVDDGWPAFFHRAHRLLRADGLLLLATRQRRDHDELADPLGLLIATARTAGFRYLQHIVVVHARPADDHLVPTPPAPDTPELIHSDLVVLSCVAPQ